LGVFSSSAPFPGLFFPAFKGSSFRDGAEQVMSYPGPINPPFWSVVFVCFSIFSAANLHAGGHLDAVLLW